MVTRSLLTTIIGFQIGWILYLVIEPSTTFILLFGGLGYAIGLFLDTSDRKRQLDDSHPSSMLSTHEIFHSHELSEAVVIYSTHNNTTSVLLDYKIEAKPENYRLSVLKNLQEFDFRIIEDNSQTFFSLCIDYPEFNYPSIREKHKERISFFYDIEERSNDFKGAIHKLIPGIVINAVQNPDIFGSETQTGNTSFKPPHHSLPPSSPKTFSGFTPNKNDRGSNSLQPPEENNSEVESEISEPDPLNSQMIEESNINEENILEDLKKPSSEKIFNESLATFFPSPYEKGDQSPQENIGNNPEIERKSKTPSMVTAKQIEESQDNILTQDNNKKPEFQLIDHETKNKSEPVIIDYSTLDSSSSMPMDSIGEGILGKITTAVNEIESRLSKKKEKIPSEDT